MAGAPARIGFQPVLKADGAGSYPWKTAGLPWHPQKYVVGGRFGAGFQRVLVNSVEPAEEEAVLRKIWRAHKSGDELGYLGYPRHA